MPRGIFGMRLVLVVKWSAESWFKRHSPLNAALAVHGGKSVWNMTNRDVFSTSLKIRFAVSRC